MSKETICGKSNYLMSTQKAISSA